MAGIRTGGRRIVSYKWEPDPTVLAGSFFTVAEALGNRMAPMAFAADEVGADIRERFLTETDPDGNPWQPWADSYAGHAEANNAGILRQSEELYDAVTDEHAMIVTNDSVFFETKMPERGVWHQEGRPGRRTKSGAANPLPARPFLGLTDTAVTAIFAVFKEWFDRAIDLYPTTTGRIGIRHQMRGGGGLFVRRATPLPIRVRPR